MARKTAMRGPKKTQQVGPGKLAATFQQPGEEAPAVAASPTPEPPKSSDSSDLRTALAQGKPIGDYEVSPATHDYRDGAGFVPVPNPVSKNLAHIDALKAISTEAKIRLTSIAEPETLRIIAKQQAELASRTGKVRTTLGSSNLLRTIGPAQSSLRNADASFEQAHLAHLAGDAVSSTIHVKEGAKHLVNAINHLESGDAWGKLTPTGRPSKSAKTNWRSDSKDGLSGLVSLAGPIHTRIATAVNGYIDHVKAVASKYPEIAKQLPAADTEPVSYTEADSYTDSPLIDKTPAKPAKQLTEQEQILADARAAALKGRVKSAPQKKGNLLGLDSLSKAEKEAKKEAEKRVGVKDENGNVAYTQEMFDKEFVENPLSKAEKKEVEFNTNTGFLRRKERLPRNGTDTNGSASWTGSTKTRTAVSDDKAKQVHLFNLMGYNPTAGSFLEDYDFPEEEHEEHVEMPDEEIPKEVTPHEVKTAPRKIPVAEPVPQAPVKESRYDVFNAASQAHKTTEGN